MEKVYRKNVNSIFAPDTYLERVYDNWNNSTIRYELSIRGVKKTISEDDATYLSTAIDIINQFANIEIELWDYNQMKKSSRLKTLIDLSKGLYPSEIKCKFFKGKFYEEFDGELAEIILNLQERWPWAIKNVTLYGRTYQIKKIALYSKISSQLSCSMDHLITTVDGKTIGLTQEQYLWGNWEIKILCILISASYLHGFNFFGTFAGHIFNSGLDIDDFIKKGYIKVKGFG